MMGRPETATKAPTARATIKPYNIELTGDNDAEINMYGEVVDERPVDWWSGEPVEGDYIVVNEFLNDIADLETRDNVTIHINSVGGSLYGGLSLYNRIKNMKPNVTTIIDGLAASAGGLIFQAGNTRKVNSASNMMIHAASTVILGYYNSKELKDVCKQLDAGTKAAVNALADASGNTVENVRSWVDKETWYTGQEIVDAGFADEMIDNSTPLSMSLSSDKAFLIANGFALSTFGMKHIPSNIPIMPPAAPTANTAAATTAPTAKPEPTTVIPESAQLPIDNISNNAGGNSIMPITTLDELRAEYPDLTAQLENSANTAGAAAERARIQSIDSIRNAIGDANLVNDAMYGEHPMTAEQLAFRAMQNQVALGATTMQQLNADTQNSGAANVGAVPTGSEPEGTAPVDEAKAVDDIVNLYKTTTKKA